MDVNDIGKMANDCGSEAYGMLTGVFDKDKFNSCFMKKVSISESCSDCYATSGEYGAKNCKAACLLGWCKQGCLECTAPATKKVAECVGDEVHFKQVTPCLEAGLLQAHPLVNPESGKCLDIYNPDGLGPSQFEDETPVNIFRCNGAKGQQWLLQDGQLVNPASGKCLDIYNPSELSPDQLQDETKVQLVQCKGNPNQQWALVNRGIGHKNLVNIPSGKCLDIYSPSGNLDDDTQVQLFTCDGDKGNQKWRFDFLPTEITLAATAHGACEDNCMAQRGYDYPTCRSMCLGAADAANPLEAREHNDWWKGHDHHDHHDNGHHHDHHDNWWHGGNDHHHDHGLTSSNDATEISLGATAHGKCEDDCMSQLGYDYPTCRSRCLGAADAAGPLEAREHNDWWKGHDHHDHHDNWHHHDHHDNWWHGGNDHHHDHHDNWWHGDDHHHHHDHHDWRHDHAVAAEVMV